MLKYAPLENYLSKADTETVPMSFAHIEAIIGCNLPPSARKYRPWWSNNSSNSSITRSWIAAGFKATQVDMDNENLVFIKIKTELKASLKRNAIEPDVHPAFGCLKGTVTLVDGANLTDPLNEQWAVMAVDAKLYNE